LQKKKLWDSLLRIYLKYHLLEEAALFVVELLATGRNEMAKRTTAPVSSATRMEIDSEDQAMRSSTQTWMPYTQIDQLLHRLKEIATDQRMESEFKQKMGTYYKDLMALVQEYFKSLPQVQ
jgi:predicted transcriptional regulator